MPHPSDRRQILCTRSRRGRDDSYPPGSRDASGICRQPTRDAGRSTACKTYRVGVSQASERPDRGNKENAVVSGSLVAQTGGPPESLRAPHN